MKKYLAVLATVATIALVAIAASSIWQVRHAANSCASLRDGGKPLPNRCVEGDGGIPRLPYSGLDRGGLCGGPDGCGLR